MMPGSVEPPLSARSLPKGHKTDFLSGSPVAPAFGRGLIAGLVEFPDAAHPDWQYLASIARSWVLEIRTVYECSTTSWRGVVETLLDEKVPLQTLPKPGDEWSGPIPRPKKRDDRERLRAHPALQLWATVRRTLAANPPSAAAFLRLYRPDLFNELFRGDARVPLRSDESGPPSRELVSSMKEAVSLSGLSRTTFWRRMKELGIPVHGPRRLPLKADIERLKQRMMVRRDRVRDAR